MIGGIIGDIAGSLLEGAQLRTYNLTEAKMFCQKAHPTDDSILLAATAHAMLDDSDDFETYYRLYAGTFNDCKFGPSFTHWMTTGKPSANSYTNGPAARAGVIGYLDKEDEVLLIAKKSAEATHIHQEAIEGAQAIAWVVWAMRKRISIQEISEELYQRWNYYVDASHSHDLNKIRRETIGIDCSAANTVPLAIFIALFQARSVETSIRLCQYVGGDTDTLACMSGLIKSQQFAPNPQWEHMCKQILWRKAQPILQVVEQFELRFDDSKSLPF
ncbi:ADP-ribosylglycohydrolase family protein [Vibrio sp. McD22-P3]|uniref:ADP-ribosylglycohydrolase family protein n=1 Tax=Vibrio sp. McD22-P3 TaxID=2724880 RepID=UPI001F1D0AF6|nr:ADP-ribosylglycohydrolase family protein [Vibrio sp. McD22-P3]MCF4174306.1 ADP-ribosylglycohydrolase family protein [Vibrio sp. McD22-P3]